MPWSRIKVESREPDFQTDTAESGRILPYAAAIREALAQAMEMDPNVFVMGQGVDDSAGMFGATRGLHEKFGPGRVFDTPLAETALTGVAVGAALGGMRPVYFHNRPDFLYLALDQIANHAAKWHYMFGGRGLPVPLVVWACIGRGWGSAAQHSQALQGLFLHIPGLRLIMPATAADAKGLMIAAIADDNPVVIIEHRFNFKQEGPVPEHLYTTPIGKGMVRRPGRDVSLIAASQMVTEAYRAAGELEKHGIDAEVVDLRTLKPLDETLILESVGRTGRAVVCDTGWRTGGVAAEVMAVIVEKGFDLLRAPVRRVACPDLPTPSGFTLEQAFYPGKDDIVKAALGIIK